MDNESKQHYKMYKSGKQWVYAGLATITMISGMGATPVILADELIADKTEATAKDDKDVTEDKTEVTADEKDADNKVENAPEVAAETPKPLPDNKVTLAPVKEAASSNVPDKVITPEKKSVATKLVAKSKTAVVDSTTDADTVKTEKAKATRAAHPFQLADFKLDNTGKIIEGFSTSFMNTYYADWDGNLTIDGNVDAQLNNITTIGDFAFSNGGDGEPKLRTLAFQNLTQLAAVKYAFTGCPNLESVSFNHLPLFTTITMEALGEEPSLTSVTFNDLPIMSQFDAYDFVNNHAITNLTFNNMPSFTEFGKDAFGNCFALQTLNLNNLPNLKTIGMGAFANSSISSLTLQGLHLLETIGESSFSSGNMTNISLLDLPLLQTIGSGAFDNNPYLQTITVGSLPKLTAAGINSGVRMV